MGEIKSGKINELVPDDKNMNKHNQYGMSLLEKSISELGLGRSIVVDKNNRIIGGNGVVETAVNLGLEDVIIVPTRGDKLVVVKREDVDLDSEVGRSLALADNAVANVNLEWDEENLSEIKGEWGINEKDWGIDLSISFDNNENNEIEQKKLSDRFLIPPFSVLDTKQGIWQERKNFWISKGIKSEIGRNASVFNVSGDIQLTDNYDKSNFSDNTIKFQDSLGTNGVSIFDPVVAELAYQWFNIPNGTILDPFAGGSVRGIVASELGFKYYGNDLREEQISANIENAKDIINNKLSLPIWTVGDSINIDKISKLNNYDMVFSCPPYADLEVYSDMDGDISNMEYKDFLNSYKTIIEKSCNLLNDNRFAVFVVGDIRDRKGVYRDFISDTIKCFKDCGLNLYNNIIIYKSIGNAALRAGKYMNQRKVCLVHEHMIVMYKGNIKKIKNNYPILDLSYLNENIENK